MGIRLQGDKIDLEELFDDIRSLVKTGKTEWERR